MRGQLTPKAEKIAEKFMKREIGLSELRLLPYIQFVAMNEQRIEPSKIAQNERAILNKWRRAGYIEGGASGLVVHKHFWDFMSEILFETYVRQES